MACPAYGPVSAGGGFHSIGYLLPSEAPQLDFKQAEDLHRQLGIAHTSRQYEVPLGVRGGSSAIRRQRQLLAGETALNNRTPKVYTQQRALPGPPRA